MLLAQLKRGEQPVFVGGRREHLAMAAASIASTQERKHVVKHYRLQALDEDLSACTNMHEAVPLLHKLWNKPSEKQASYLGS